MQELKGTGTALITPFTDDQIDYSALEQIIELQIEGGVEFIVSMGTTGEVPTLSKTEKTSLVHFTKKIINNRIPLVIGFGGNNTKALCDEISSFDLSGVSAILSSSPAYSKPTQNGIFHHYSAIAESTNTPIIIYNVPGRTSSNVMPNTVFKLANSSKQFIGIKEATGDLAQATSILKNCTKDFLFWSGDDPTALATTAIGGHGCISVISNLFPKQYSKMIQLGLQSKFDDALKIHHSLFDLHKWLYIDGNPTGIKQAMAEHNMCSNKVRLPLYEMNIENKNQLIKVLREIDHHYILNS